MLKASLKKVDLKIFFNQIFVAIKLNFDGGIFPQLEQASSRCQ